ncbi:RNA polymerase sigma factor [Paenibacillus aquistagni]|uniref:RNA polymerase sigma factor n=1 Tax=Paenibacillus aquistagni TaxID=1852522 RepID=UPI00145C18F3|nr:sigma-70 family RNA polymerase sigma factor [Paenibacillus aquistagni]NMM54534.1 sigma-70 family RNA polymerase sigma factor [Paenibacillus aquistagni]
MSMYQTYYKLVYPDVYRILQDPWIAEDVIQEAFLKALMNMNRLRHEAALTSWFRQIAKHQAFDYLRRSRKHRSMIPLHGNTTPDNDFYASCEYSDVSQFIENKLRNESLLLSLSKLRPQDQNLIKLHYFEDKSYKEIAQELQSTEQIISQRLARARKKLRQSFTKTWPL